MYLILSYVPADYKLLAETRESAPIDVAMSQS